MIPSISAFGSPNLHFYFSFRSFRQDFLSILNDRGIVPPVKALFRVHVFVSGYLRADDRGDDLHFSGVLDVAYGMHFCEHSFG